MSLLRPAVIKQHNTQIQTLFRNFSTIIKSESLPAPKQRQVQQQEGEDSLQREMATYAFK